jgi:hypothetical protein
MVSLEVSDINTELFISEIQSRYVIWDQNSREFSDRNLKKKAIEEICNLFIQGFTEKTVKEKNETSKRNTIIFICIYAATVMPLLLEQNSRQIYLLSHYPKVYKHFH